MRRTKIIATYGPSLHAHFEEACKTVDVVRVNFSHNDEQSWAEIRGFILKTIGDSGRDIKLLADLPGPKVRVGVLDEKIRVKAGQKVRFGYADRKLNGFVPVNYEGICRDARRGATIIIGDGEPRFGIDRIAGSKIYTTAMTTGYIGSRKGVSLCGANISLPVPTEEDMRLARFAASEDFDYIAMSFVKSADQVDALREYTGRHPIVSKIERRDAIADIDRIARHSEMLMVARGDLGLDLSLEEVPLAQRRIIQAAKRHRKPVIIATQVLTSMIGSPIPTRAEVNDIANGVLAGADYIMMSDETTVGSYPLEAIGILCRTIEETERSER